MSKRGSFVTEYIYCDKCFEAAKKILLSKNKYLCSTTIPAWGGLTNKPELPIIAGKMGALSPDDDYLDEFIPDLEKNICHKMRIAILFDSGKNRILEIFPGK